MATVPLQSISASGSVPAYTACAAGGDELVIGDAAFAFFKNTSTAAITVTFVTPGTVRGLAIADQPLTVGAGGELMVALDRDLYANANRRAGVTYSAVAGLSVAVLQR